jgi:cyclophilin family peptidyl-prolyl cis-trans isomerase
MKTLSLLRLALSLVAAFAICCSLPATAADNPIVRLATTIGNIDIELYPDKAPLTVSNFLQLVDEGFYDGLIFHRVIAGFMIQGGGYDSDLQHRQPPGTIANESHNRLPNQKGSIAMARLADPDSASTQFYINVSHNPNLDATLDRPGYTVFGQVTAGMEVVAEIELVATHLEAGMSDVPVEDVIINQATRR